MHATLPLPAATDFPRSRQIGTLDLTGGALEPTAASAGAADGAAVAIVPAGAR